MSLYNELSILATDFLQSVGRIESLIKKIKTLPVYANLKPYVDVVEDTLLQSKETHSNHVDVIFDPSFKDDTSNSYIRDAAYYLYKRIVEFEEIEEFFSEVIDRG